VIDAAMLAASAVAVELGFRAGRARRRAGIDEDLSTIEGAMLGLLALLLAFTCALASSRYETRKKLVTDEANAIGTAVLRARLEASPHGARIEALLHEYVYVRLEFFHAGVDEARLAAVRRDTTRPLDEIWATAKQIVDSSTPTVVTPLLLQSLNEVVDLSDLRRYAMRDHVPEPVILRLMLVALASVGLVGHCAGGKGRSSLWTSLVVPAIVVACLIVTIDLDRPRRGIIVGQQPMIDRTKSLQPR
jgi:hypothetical protein